MIRILKIINLIPVQFFTRKKCQKDGTIADLQCSFFWRKKGWLSFAEHTLQSSSASALFHDCEQSRKRQRCALLVALSSPQIFVATSLNFIEIKFCQNNIYFTFYWNISNSLETCSLNEKQEKSRNIHNLKNEKRHCQIVVHEKPNENELHQNCTCWSRHQREKMRNNDNSYFFEYNFFIKFE